MIHNLDLAIQFAVKDSALGFPLPSRAHLRRWVKAAQRGDMALTLRLTDSDEAQGLNRDYRGKDYATNVLTFVYDTAPPAGDVCLCAPVVAREAAEQGKDLEAHWAHLVIHGVLHLQGYDHEHKTDAVTMESVERFIMQHLGYRDPYEDGRR
jgi:probable rRNA maturation factor